MGRLGAGASLTTSATTGTPAPGPVFARRRLDRRLARRGYVVCRGVLDPERVADLRRAFDQWCPEPDAPFHTTGVHEDRHYREAVDRAVRAALAPWVADTLVGYEGLVGSFVSKAPTRDNVVDLHLDVSMVDETRHRALNVWCPLADTDARTGALQVVPGSHLRTPARRGSGTLQVDVAAVVDQLGHRRRTLRLRAGDAVVCDHRLLHGSAPHHGTDVRVAVAMAATPVGAPPMRFHGTASGEIEAFRVPRDHFVQPGSFTERPAGEPVAVLPASDRSRDLADVVPRRPSSAAPPEETSG